MDDKIYILPTPGGWALKQVATLVQMQSFSHELSTPVANKCICIYIRIRKNSFVYTGDDDGSVVRYLTGIKPAWFQSKLEASRVFRHTKKLWYNESVCL